MAGIALLTAQRNVANRRGLSILGNIGATMAGRTLTSHERRISSKVIHRARAEAGESVVMAGIALRAGRDMTRSGRFGQGINRDIAPTVTGRALTCRTGVIHAGRLESGVVAVAVTTLAGSRRVRTRLAEGSLAVMARCATTNCSGAMHEGSRLPGNIATSVTGVALSGRRNMR